MYTPGTNRAEADTNRRRAFLSGLFLPTDAPRLISWPKESIGFLGKIPVRFA